MSHSPDNSAQEHYLGLTEPVQLAAVQQNALAIQYIENPSEAVQLAAIQENKLAIQYMSQPSKSAQMLHCLLWG